MTVPTPSALRGPRFLQLTALGLALVQAGPVLASSLSVHPVRIDLGRRAASALVEVRNSGAAPIEVDVAAFAWRQELDGATVLEPTDRLIAFPRRATLPPGETRRIRVGLPRPEPVAVERTYRLIVEELPSAAAAEPGKIAVRTRFSIPVFHSPERPDGSAVVTAVAIENGDLRFRLLNPGNAHVRLTSVAVAIEDASGSRLVHQELPAWYLLARGDRSYSWPLDRRLCPAATALVVTVEGGGDPSLRLPLPADACGSAADAR